MMNGWTDKTIRWAMELLGDVDELNRPYENGTRCRISREGNWLFLRDCTCDQQLPRHITADNIESACRDELIRRGGGRYIEERDEGAPEYVNVGYTDDDGSHFETFAGDTIAEAMIAALEGTPA